MHELLLLNCICIAEVEKEKQSLIGEFLLNPTEIQEILGFDNELSPLKAIYDFIHCNSDIGVEEG